MAVLAKFSLALLLAFALVGFSVSEHSPETSPSPPPELGADSPPSLAPAPHIASPANSPSTSSPPAPPPSDLSPGSSPTPSQSPLAPKSTPPAPAPVPAPSALSDIGHVSADGDGQGTGSSEGMSGAKKGGIAIGVILAAGLVVVGGFVYKKRRDNIRRSQYGYAARREIL
ncbi:proline-rich receptor-like protein kinase PERK8 [Corylus avellana]|uniref:proline-rich receptor-like protein kinase PERK8 n=1 Tax=Corylus avellana TaxID=13451 RepID=UPI001E210DF4|nr:proline-rich receptor-like protein kinase PERK8 [Corylus avellana]